MMRYCFRSIPSQACNTKYDGTRDGPCQKAGAHACLHGHQNRQWYLIHVVASVVLRSRKRCHLGVHQYDRNECKSTQLVSGGLSPHQVHVASTVSHSTRDASFAKLEDGKAQ
jgi:hypothetical protein